MYKTAVTFTEDQIAEAGPVVRAVIDAMEAAESIDVGTLAEYVYIMERIANEANARANNARALIAQGYTV